MKSLQARYGALQAVNFIATCTVCIFATIFLQSRGLSNTEVGVVTAGGCVLSVVFGPLLSGLISRARSLSINAILQMMFAACGILFLALVVLPIPVPLMMAAYATIYAVLMSTPPLLSQICMDYLRQGERIDFGFTRGLGSVSYAVAAAVVGRIVNVSSPNVLAPIFAVSCIAMVALLRGMPACEKPAIDAGEDGGAKGVGMVGFMLRYRLLAVALIGFGLSFSASACLSTYLINIMTGLGGDASLYGIGIFVMALTELPAMMVVTPLRQRLGTGALFALGGLSYLFRNTLIATAPSLPVLFIGLLFQGLSYGTLSALFAYYVSEVCTSEDEMMGQTLINLMTAGIGATLGNFLGGVLQDGFGVGAMSAFAVAVSVAGAALMCGAGAAERRRAR